MFLSTTGRIVDADGQIAFQVRKRRKLNAALAYTAGRRGAGSELHTLGSQLRDAHWRWCQRSNLPPPHYRALRRLFSRIEQPRSPLWRSVAASSTMR